MILRKTAMRTAALAAAITTAVAGGALIAPTAAAQGSSNDPAPAFYHPPADLPDGSGTFIKSEIFPLAGAIPPIPGAEQLSDNVGPLSTDAQRIMYTSVGSRGQEIAVTGTYLQPRTPWAGPGTRPLAVVAPGTQGQGECERGERIPQQFHLHAPVGCNLEIPRANRFRDPVPGICRIRYASIVCIWLGED